MIFNNVQVYILSRLKCLYFQKIFKESLTYSEVPQITSPSTIFIIMHHKKKANREWLALNGLVL